MTYHPYQAADETKWLHCRVVSFLDSQYFDDVITKKPTYDSDSIELVVVENNAVVGFMDTQIERTPGSMCHGEGETGAVICELGVHPDCRRQGIAAHLLELTIHECKQRGIRRIQAWTREDTKTCGWYVARGFECIYYYWHVWLTGKKLRSLVNTSIPGLTMVKAYCEYTGEKEAELAATAERMLQCRCYEHSIDS